jgi:hypothetical protein
MNVKQLRNEKSPKRKCASGLMFLERETGLEPATSTLARWHSTTELLPQVVSELPGTSRISSPGLLRCQAFFHPVVRHFPAPAHHADDTPRAPRRRALHPRPPRLRPAGGSLAPNSGGSFLVATLRASAAGTPRARKISSAVSDPASCQFL